MTAAPPTISVLLPVYNTNPDHLRAAIDSVLAQTFTDFELLIYNDASTDPRVEATVLAYTDPRIIYTPATENMGIARVRNRLISLARGRYLAVMDHDDLCHPQRFEKQVACLDSDPSLAVCGTAHRRFGRLLKRKTIVYPLGHEDVRAHLFFKNVIHHPSAMLRADTLRTHGIRYDETLISLNDRQLFLDISGVAQACNLTDVLCFYRIHGAMTSTTRRTAIKDEQRRVRQTLIAKIGARLTAEQEESLQDFILNGRTRGLDNVGLYNGVKALALVAAANAESNHLPNAAFLRACKRVLIKRCLAALFRSGLDPYQALCAAAPIMCTASVPWFFKLFHAVKKT